MTLFDFGNSYSDKDIKKNKVAEDLIFKQNDICGFCCDT